MAGEWSSYLINGGLIAGAASLGLIGVRFVSRRILAWVRALQCIPEARQQQLVTLVQTGHWIVNALLVATTVMMLLSEFGLDITPLLASVGVIGLAVSLGAQTLIKDFIGGILILSENQYAIGDSIVVGAVSGQVERLTLRATHVRALNGDLYVVPNGEVRVLANQTRDWSRAVVDVGVAYEEDLDWALGVLEKGAAAFGREPAFEPDLLEAPQMLGVNSLGDLAVIVRIVVKTQPGKQWAIGRALRKFLLAACEREGVGLPYPRHRPGSGTPQEVWLRTMSTDRGRALEE